MTNHRNSTEFTMDAYSPYSGERAFFSYIGCNLEFSRSESMLSKVVSFGNNSGAMQGYMDAVKITRAERHGFIEGMICERLAVYYQEMCSQAGVDRGFVFRYEDEIFQVEAQHYFFAIESICFGGG
ncbi:hypothetical protein ACP8HI_17750 [Paenibacillus sp. FA6]|uniref:hypothetical protein n=1 Tax=Paenibacillus sp. FA6 TaxID=3413029 RepID=UPI003F65F2F7